MSSKNQIRQFLLWFTISCGLLISCTTLVNIRTEPEGLEAYYQGSRIGKTPVSQEMSDLFFESHIVEFKKDRKSLRMVTLVKEAKVDVRVCTGWGLFWAYGPRANQNFTIDEALSANLPNPKPGKIRIVNGGSADTLLKVDGETLLPGDGFDSDVSGAKVLLCTGEGCTDLGYQDFPVRDLSYVYFPAR